MTVTGSVSSLETVTATPPSRSVKVLVADVATMPPPRSMLASLAVAVRVNAEPTLPSRSVSVSLRSSKALTAPVAVPVICSR